MNLGMTLLLQGIGFFIFLFVVYKFVLPPLADAVEGRRRQIADGLAEAEKGKASLAIAQKEVDKLIAEAKAKAADIVAQAEKQRNVTIEASKADAKAAGEREKQMAADEIAQLSVKAKKSCATAWLISRWRVRSASSSAKSIPGPLRSRWRNSRLSCNHG